MFELPEHKTENAFLAGTFSGDTPTFTLFIRAFCRRFDCSIFPFILILGVLQYPKLATLSFPGKKTFNNLDAHFLEKRTKVRIFFLMNSKSMFFFFFNSFSRDFNSCMRDISFILLKKVPNHSGPQPIHGVDSAALSFGAKPSIGQDSLRFP